MIKMLPGKKQCSGHLAPIGIPKRSSNRRKLTNGPLIINLFFFSVLNISPEDATASHCKVVCLIQTSKFQEAVQFIERYKLNELAFEKAYCEYRLNLPEKSLKTIDSVNVPNNQLPAKLKELRAQVLYRLERFEECFDVYRDIIKNSADDDYDDERTTNLSAVVANLAIEGTVSLFK